MGQLGLMWQMEKVNMVGGRNVQPLATLAHVAKTAVKQIWLVGSYSSMCCLSG